MPQIDIAAGEVPEHNHHYALSISISISVRLHAMEISGKGYVIPESGEVGPRLAWDTAGAGKGQQQQTQGLASAQSQEVSMEMTLEQERKQSQKTRTCVLEPPFKYLMDSQWQQRTE